MECVVSDSDQPYVFAAVQVISTEMIDGGRTLAVRLRKADGREAVLLLSKPVAEDLNLQMDETLRSASGALKAPKP
ncbi:hypothetical protein MBRA_01492 [Methylobacterium brachiatum]|nr:hypothetical protein MBRA_01492 [Methylobacterium brachiatum]